MSDSNVRTSSACGTTPSRLTKSKWSLRACIAAPNSAIRAFRSLSCEHRLAKNLKFTERDEATRSWNLYCGSTCRDQFWRQSREGSADLHRGQSRRHVLLAGAEYRPRTVVHANPL